MSSYNKWLFLIDLIDLVDAIIFARARSHIYLMIKVAVVRGFPQKNDRLIWKIWILNSSIIWLINAILLFCPFVESWSDK